VLTAAMTIEDRVGGLGLGADDYLPKPFAFAELVAGCGRCCAGPSRRSRRCSSGDLWPIRPGGAPAERAGRWT
jgi:DNA-binding response OmpR family regulator